MLQRAASNAYSWWWASHIRTNQSKWLDANLQDMENRVKIMLKLLGQEADSFGKRAEMYYHTRPEVISHVEQLYRAYRALVERYDHISKELHKANHTIATACPEEVQYAMLEEQDHDFPKAITPIHSHKTHKSTVQEILNAKRHGPSGWNKLPSDPHICTEQAREEIGRLQKAILVLQTEKEYVKSSYESGIARYWEIEKQIADTQKEICVIQDKFDAHAAIGDDEARGLMTITALRSCQGTISELVRHFEELIRLAAVELEKTKSLRAQLYAMDGNTETSSREACSTGTSVNARSYPVTQTILELQPIYEKLDKFFASGSESSAEEIAETVDELVDKVINLELRFPKQTAQINQLMQENENLQNKLDELQDEIALRDDQSDLNEQIKQLEDEFRTVRVLERSITEEEASVSIGFSEVLSCIINISKALGSVGPEDLHNLSIVVGDDAPTQSHSLGQDTEDVSEVVNDNGNDGIHGSRNADEEKIPGSCLMQQVRYMSSIHSENHINLFVSSENENRVHDSDEGNVDSSPGEVLKSSSENENGSRNFPKGKIVRGVGIVTQTHLLHSDSMDTLDKKYGCNEASQSLTDVADENIGDGSSFTTISLIQEEGLGDSKSQNTSGQIGPIASSELYSLKEKDSLEESSLPEATCFRGADKSLHLGHANEAQSVEELTDQGGQLNAPQNIESSNEFSQIGFLKDDDCISLCHVDNIQDMKNKYSSEVRDKTSLCVPAEDSEQVLTNLEKKRSHGKELASEATTSINHGGRSQGEKSVAAPVRGWAGAPWWRRRAPLPPRRLLPSSHGGAGGVGLGCLRSLGGWIRRPGGLIRRPQVGGGAGGACRGGGGCAGLGRRFSQPLLSDPVPFGPGAAPKVVGHPRPTTAGGVRQRRLRMPEPATTAVYGLRRAAGLRARQGKPGSVCQTRGGDGRRSCAAAMQPARRCPSGRVYAGWRGGDDSEDNLQKGPAPWHDVVPGDILGESLGDGDARGRHFPC